MDSVASALKGVEDAVAKKKPMERKRLAEIAGHVTSHLVLLKLQSVSEAISRKLSNFLRESLVILYAGVGLPALRLTSSIFESVYYERLLPAIGNMQKDQQILWESVLHALLAGVLDYLDAQDSNAAKDAIGEALYPSLCGTSLSLTAPKTSIDLRCTAYSILSDSAASHTANQRKLRDTDILGGERLGSCIWRTRDYLPMEGLLNLFARAIPPTHNSSLGRSKRAAYIDCVFRSSAPPEAVATGSKVAELLANVPTSNWEETALRIVDVLANGSIAFPQPFLITEVVACDDPYSSDRLYVDDKGLLINVLLGDDQYESLEIKYSTIRGVKVGETSHESCRVAVSMDEVPNLGKKRLSARVFSGDDPGPGISFVLKKQDAHRFLETLTARGLECPIPELSWSPSIPKSSLAITPAYLEVNSAGSLVNHLSQTERIENVSQFYKTDELSDDIMSCGSDLADGHDAANLSNNPNSNQPAFPHPRPANPAPLLSPEGQKADPASKVLDSNPDTSNSHALSRATSHSIRAAAFGFSDEELSEISDYDSPIHQSRVLRRTSTSASTRLVRGRISFQPLLDTSTGTSSSATRVARGAVGKVILDSDDGSPPTATILSVSLRAKRKAVLVRDSTVDEAQPSPPSAPVPTVAAPSAAIPAVSVTPSPPLGDVTLVSSNGREKVLRFSDIIAPDFHAALSSPAIPPRSALKSSLLKATISARPGLPTSSDAALVPYVPVSASALVPSVPVSGCALHIEVTKAPAIKASDILNDLAPPSSSPTPGARKTVKAKLRKKEFQDQTHKVLGNMATKRKAGAALEDPSACPDDAPHRTAKRARSVAVPSAREAGVSTERAEFHGGVATDRLSSEVYRPRATTAPRAIKKYHAKKARTSSPGEASDAGTQRKTPSVDYDALPSPPRPHVVLAAKPSSPLPKTKPKRAPKPRLRANTRARPGAAAQSIEESKTQVGPQHQPADLLSKSIARVPRLEKAALGQNVNLDKGEDRKATPAADCPPAAPTLYRSRRDSKTHKMDIHGIPATSATERPQEVDIPAIPTENIMMEQGVLELTETPGTSAAWTPGVDGDKGGRISQKMTSGKSKLSNTPWDVAFESASALRTIVVAGNNGENWEFDEPALQHSTPRGDISTPDCVVHHAEPEPVGSAKDGGVQGHPQREQAALAPSGMAFEPAPSSESTRFPCAVAKPAPLPQIVVKQETVTIDLTLDSPPRHPKRDTHLPLVSKRASSDPHAPATTELKCKITTHNSGDDDITSFPRQGGDDRMNAKATLHQPHATIDRTYGIDMPELTIQATRRRRNANKVTRDDVDLLETRLSTDAATNRIIDMLSQFHEVIVYNIENKFEGLRQQARLGRNELLHSALIDLESMRADGVKQFNSLVDLEAEYATTGRGLIHHSEDWVKTNQELSQSLAHALELHDKTMLSKKMPTGLITLTL